MSDNETEEQSVALKEVRHGLLAKHSTNNLESRNNFESMIRQHEASFQTEDAIQQGIIEEMVLVYWRMRRLSALENGMMNQAIDATSPDADNMTRMIDAQNSLTDSHRYNLLNLYEDRCHRRYYRALNSIMALRRAQEKLAS
jgi:hypothetical protein